jgi:hypothetical protein
MRFAFCRGAEVSADTAMTIAESGAGPEGRVVWETEIHTGEIFIWWLPDGSRILGYMPSQENTH